MKGTTIRCCVILALALVSVPAPVSAQDVTVPVSVHLPLLCRIAVNNRNLGDQPDRVVHLGVVCQPKSRESMEVTTEIERLLAGDSSLTVRGVSIRPVRIECDNTGGLDSAISQNHIELLYLTPLRGVAISDIAASCRRKGVLSITGVADYVTEGVSIGVGIKEKRPRLMVNLDQSRGEGVTFSPDLLRIAVVYSDGRRISLPQNDSSTSGIPHESP